MSHRSRNDISSSFSSGRLRALGLSGLLALVLLASAAYAAVAASPASALSSSEAFARIAHTGPMAVDPNNGHLYVANTPGNGGSSWIEEFTPWGEFVKSIGMEVSTGPVNEQQELRIRAARGSFTLSFDGRTTSDIPVGADAATVEAELDSLESIGGLTPDPGKVGVKERTGSVDGVTPYVYTVAFRGALAVSDVPQLTVAEGSDGLGGGEPSSLTEVRTLVESSPGGPGTAGDCTPESGCQDARPDLKGGPEVAGRVYTVTGLATDQNGNLYVTEANPTSTVYSATRIQKFSPSGRFLFMIGNEVNKTKVAEREEQEAKSEPVTVTEAQERLCTAESGDECGRATRREPESAETPRVGAVSPDGTVYAFRGERIEMFSADGDSLGLLPDPDGARAGKKVLELAINPVTGVLYVDYDIGIASGNVTEELDELSPTTGAVVGKLSIDDAAGMSTDDAGNLYVVSGRFGRAGVTFSGEGKITSYAGKVVQFNATGDQLTPTPKEESDCIQELEELYPSQIYCSLFPTNDPSHMAPRGVAAGSSGVIYVMFRDLSGDGFEGKGLFTQAFGPPPLTLEAPPPAPPSIDAQYAVSVTSTEAQVRAQINPHFFSGSLGTTHYYLQYASAACVQAEGWEGDCVSAAPAPPGAILKGAAVDEDVATASVSLSNLAPGMSYRYRFVAEGTGAPGEVVYGQGGVPGAPGRDAEFNTVPAAGQAAECSANSAFRVGPSALLPDCRAYEMVSPLDKEGGDIRVLTETLSLQPAVLNQAATSGDKLAYGSYRAFGGAVSAPYTTQFIAVRGAAGWKSHPISPPRTEQIMIPAGTLDTEFKLFSPDLCESWLQTFSEPALTSNAVPGYPNLYRRHDGACDAQGYEALTTLQPPNQSGASYSLELQGVAAEGGQALFAAQDNLPTGGIAPAPQPAECVEGGEEFRCQARVYELGPDGARYVCVLPSGAASDGPCTAGGPVVSVFRRTRFQQVAGAISGDGQRVFWTAADGAIYVREHPTESQSHLALGAASGTGKITAGSTTITSLFAATGTADFTAGSPSVTLTGTTVGEFVVGQPISAGPRVPAGTTIVSISGSTLHLSADATVTAANASIASIGPMPFAVGQQITAPGIPYGTVITDLAPGSLTMSREATKTKANTALSAYSECSEPAKACTLPVSAAAESESGGSGSQYWVAADDGSRAVFSTGSAAESLYELDLETGATTKIAGGVPGVLGASSDAKRLYFVSDEDLDGTGPAQEGSPNLYLREVAEGGARLRFIAILAPADADRNPKSGAAHPTSDVAWEPGRRAAQVSDDGLSATFTSVAPLTGYDNRDARSGQPGTEVYVYNAAAEGGAGKLSCASCNPRGARPAGGIVASGVFVVAQISGAENDLHEANVLTDGGRRLFFESSDALVPGDTNGAVDVYEWEEPGVGNCTTSSSDFSTVNGGCVSLISSGLSPQPSEFVEASPDGSNVFIATISSLLSQDYGLVDIYDAREGGGFPAPPTPAAQCEGEACQGPSSPPNDPTPASSSFEGAGNVRPQKRKAACSKRKVRKGGHCVAKKHSKHKKRHSKHKRRGKHKGHKQHGKRAGKTHRRAGADHRQDRRK